MIKHNNIRNKMGKITLSLSKYADKKLRLRAKKNFRSISKEVEYLITKIDEIEGKKY